MIQISALATCISCCDDVAWFFKFFSTFLVSVVVGIVYKDLHDVLITDQPFRTITGATRWGYPPTVSQSNAPFIQKINLFNTGFLYPPKVFGLVDNCRGFRSKTRKITRECHLKVQKSEGKNTIKISINCFSCDIYSEYIILMFIFRTQIREGEKKCMFWSDLRER